MKYKEVAHGMLVDNVEKALPFYRDILGYKVVRTGPSFVLFNAEGARLFMWEWQHIVDHMGAERTSKVKHRCMFAIEFDNQNEIDMAYEELSGKGVEFIAEPQNWPWNARAAAVLQGTALRPFGRSKPPGNHLRNRRSKNRPLSSCSPGKTRLRMQSGEEHSPEGPVCVRVLGAPF